MSVQSFYHFADLILLKSVYATLTIQLANAFNSTTLRVWGSGYAVAILLLWISVSLRSIWEMKTFMAHHHSASDIMDEKIDEFEQQFERRWIQPQDSAQTSMTELP